MDDANPSNPATLSPASDLPPSASRDARSHRPVTSRRALRARLTFATPRAPETTSAWLHVVSGPSATLVARGVLELSARFLSSGHRVLMVDGGPRLRLHDRFDREMRWGVIECLTGEMPVLGLIQDVGRLGFYLLAHGLPVPRTHWLQLGRLLDEARPHFGRAVLALDPDAPAAVGESLAGWHLEGWWAGGGREKRPADRLADRVGIHLSDLDLDAMPEAKLEALDVRLWSLIGERSGVDVADTPVTDPVPLAVAPAAIPLGSASVPVTASTLDCDARVRERLRFLLWMRRVQSEGQRHEPASTPAAAAPSA